MRISATTPAKSVRTGLGGAVATDLTLVSAALVLRAMPAIGVSPLTFASGYEGQH